MPARLRVALGVLLLTAGLVLGGYLAWEYWGTTWQSERRHAAITEDLERTWASGGREVRTDAGPADAVVRIPAFGAAYAVPLLEGTGDAALAAGFGHESGTAEPGAEGNLVVAGHRVTHGEPLWEMPSLEPGDEVVVETADEVFTYVLDTAGDGLEVGVDEDWVTAARPVPPLGTDVVVPDDPRLLTLVTCADLFHSDRRLVAFGHLASVAPRG